jgi:hypothetical protein
VGHRVVHGGPQHFEPALVTAEIKSATINQVNLYEGKEIVGRSARRETIPAQADNYEVASNFSIGFDATLNSLWPHMHLRGKDMTFIATYPDGHEDVLLHVPKYDFRWQLQYELVTPVHLPAGSTIKAIGHYDNSAGNRNNPAPGQAVHWSEQTADEMFNGWMEMSVDKNVIRPNPVYTVGIPVNQRVSLRISGGPPGTVSVRNADGSVVTSATIQSAPSFIEPWLYASGQTIKADPSGSDIGNVTVTLYDVPPDVTGSIAIDGRAVAVATTQPGQNGWLTFEGQTSQEVTVHVIGNRMSMVSVSLLGIDGATVLASSTSAAGSFSLPPVVLPSIGTYTIGIDPGGMNVGLLNVALTSRRDR